MRNFWLIAAAYIGWCLYDLKTAAPSSFNLLAHLSLKKGCSCATASGAGGVGDPMAQHAALVM